MPLGNLQIERLARLARLNLSPKEVTRFSSEREQIVHYFEMLQQVDTSQVDLEGKAADTAGLRHDTVRDSMPRESAMKNAAQTDTQLFLVPRVIR